ncbi:MAG: RNA polymerase sigma factor [Phycisphaerae bacterium]
MRRVVSADDVLQDIWITVICGASDITSTGSEEFDPWLTRIAQRRIADAIRRAGAMKRGGSDVIVHERWQSTSFVDLFARVSSPQDTPSKEVSTREAVDAVQIALAALPENYRTAITLRYVEGRSHDQIAKAMRKSRSAVNSLLFRGMRKLKELLGSAGRFFSDNGTCDVPGRAT